MCVCVCVRHGAPSLLSLRSPHRHTHSEPGGGDEVVDAHAESLRGEGHERDVRAQLQQARAAGRELRDAADE